MRFDDVKLRNKLLAPLVPTGLIIILLVLFSSTQMGRITSDANEMITKRGVATTLLARALREVTQAEVFGFVMIAMDGNSAVAQRATTNFKPSIDNAVTHFNEAAALLPDSRDTIKDFVARLEKAVPALTEAYDIGKSTPGLDQGSAIKASDLDAMAKGAKLLGEVELDLGRLVDDVRAFNEKTTDENTARAAALSAQSDRAFWTLWASGIFAIAFAAGLSIWLSVTKVVRPILRVTDNMKRLADGDVAVEVAGRDRRDEVGAMAEAVQVFKDNAVEKIRLEKEAAASRAAADAERARQESVKAEEARQQARMVDAIAQGLENLAQGKLTHRIDGAFPAEYERLRTDFNGAMERLQATVSVVASNTLALRSGTQDISSASDDLARRTEQQAANLEETAAALQQITETVRKTSQGAQHAHQLIAEAKTQAEQSGHVVREAVGAMTNIEKSSGQMGQIIGVIDEIAFQTNLLALNAGVEAARAGEAGRGFAVVASEVRGLAQRSAEAAKEIKTLIMASSQQVEQGVELVDRTGQALQTIVASITEITQIVAEIAAGAKEQASGLAEINTAVTQMDKNTQQNAAMVEESTAASHGLAQETDQLAKIIEGFDVGRASAAPAAARAPAAAARPKSAPRKVANGPTVTPAAREEWSEF